MRLVQLVIYGFWGVFLCLAGIEKFGDFFSAGTGLWSVVMLSVAGLCQLLASAAAISWAVLASVLSGLSTYPINSLIIIRFLDPTT
ncbi:Uncharacterised protein [Escherichia coli]|nr:Uncharacterised protein [Escherichia coli]